MTFEMAKLTHKTSELVLIVIGRYDHHPNSNLMDVNQFYFLTVSNPKKRIIK